MSIKVMSAVWDYYPRGGSELLTLLALSDWSDDQGRCFPGISAIATKTRLSRSQAQRVVHRLIDEGVVSVTGNHHGGVPGATRRYQIKLEKLNGSVNANPTGRTGETGSSHATGSSHLPKGSHPCGETGSAHATQTVIEPSITVSTVASQNQSTKVPNCPTEKLIEIYHMALPELLKVKLSLKSRERALSKLWAWVFIDKRTDGQPRATDADQALVWFKKYFERVRDNDFLMGRTPKAPGHENWKCDIDFLLTERGLKQVIEKTGDSA